MTKTWAMPDPTGAETRKGTRGGGGGGRVTGRAVPKVGREVPKGADTAVPKVGRVVPKVGRAVPKGAETEVPKVGRAVPKVGREVPKVGGEAEEVGRGAGKGGGGVRMTEEFWAFSAACVTCASVAEGDRPTLCSTAVILC